jgi:hypothetical protein
MQGSLSLKESCPDDVKLTQVSSLPLPLFPLVILSIKSSIFCLGEKGFERSEADGRFKERVTRDLLHFASDFNPSFLCAIPDSRFHVH